MDESKKSAQLGVPPQVCGVAQAGSVIIVPSDHTKNVMENTPTSGAASVSDLIAETAISLNVDRNTAAVLVGLGGDFWERLIRYAEDPVRFPLRRRPSRKREITPRKGAANG